MFTNKVVNLARYSEQCGIQVLRDCSFCFVGKIPSKLDKRLVSCKHAQHIKQASKMDGIVGIITTKDLIDLVPENLGVGSSPDPQKACYAMHSILCDIPGFHWEDFDTIIDPSAQIHPTATIAEKNVKIGSRSIIGPNCYINERSIIGSDCRIGPLNSIGWDSFELEGVAGDTKVVPHAGAVRVGNNVEIHSHCSIARSAFGGYTEIGSGVKIDSHVLITHDCKIESGVRIAAGVVLCGRAEVGIESYIGPSSVVSNGVKIDKMAHVSIGSVVVNDVYTRETVTGNFAVPHLKWLKFIASLK